MFPSGGLCLLFRLLSLPQPESFRRMPENGVGSCWLSLKPLRPGNEPRAAARPASCTLNEQASVANLVEWAQRVNGSTGPNGQWASKARPDTVRSPDSAATLARAVAHPY